MPNERGGANAEIAEQPLLPLTGEVAEALEDIHEGGHEFRRYFGGAP